MKTVRRYDPIRSRLTFGMGRSPEMLVLEGRRKILKQKEKAMSKHLYSLFVTLLGCFVFTSTFVLDANALKPQAKVKAAFMDQ